VTGFLVDSIDEAVDALAVSEIDRAPAGRVSARFTVDRMAIDIWNVPSLLGVRSSRPSLSELPMLGGDPEW